VGWEKPKGFGNIVNMAFSAIGSCHALVLYPEGWD